MNQVDEVSPVYREVQRICGLWLRVIVVASLGLSWYSAASQLLFHRPLGDKPMPDVPRVVFWLIFGNGLPVLLLLVKLITEVHADGIYVRFVPFHRSFRRIAFEELKRCEVRTYRPILAVCSWSWQMASDC